MPTLGLTGGIGSGKSTVAQRLVELGAHLVDTDAIARDLTRAGGAAMPALAAEFGAAAIGADGALDRAWMRRLAFEDRTAKARLEAILHPLIGAAALQLAAAHRGRPLVYDVPLLAESRGPWRARCDRILVVDCTVRTQVERVAARPGWTAEAARRVIAQQADRGARRAVADAVIHNDAISLAELASEVDRFMAWWLGRDGRPVV
ncbi:MAG: dephospho-CoA kinase, partial [Burkholderiales bacterium]|nr:dephospho-CoA kinase [Burkholderiales bacterium]